MSWTDNLTKEAKMGTNTHLHANDDTVVERNRKGRWMVAIGSPIATVLLGRVVGIQVAEALQFPTLFGAIPGTVTGVYLSIGYLVPKLFATVSAGSAFMTVDAVKSWGKMKAYVTYGAGLHPTFPWEIRESGNNFSLEEQSASFSFRVVLVDGDLTINYTARLRADITNLPNFLTGAASASHDLGELINTVLSKTLAGKTINEALGMTQVLNEALKATFAVAQSDFEHRFGVMVGDITIGTILPSADVMKTRSGKAEMADIDQMALDSLKKLHNIKTELGWTRAINSGKITQNMIDDAIRRAQAATGNTDGLTITEARQRIELAVTGVSPEIAAAVAATAPLIARALENKKPAPARAKPKGAK